MGELIRNTKIVHDDTVPSHRRLVDADKKSTKNCIHGRRLQPGLGHQRAELCPMCTAELAMLERGSDE